MPIRSYIELFKMRIGVMIALSAVMGYCAIAQRFSVVEVTVLAVAMMLGSAAASVFNHWYDRDIDREMTRTRNRPLAADSLQNPEWVLVIAAFLLVSGLGLAWWMFNAVVALHLFLGVFFYAIVYTVWLKRRTWLNIVIGGAAGSFAVLAGSAAVDPHRVLLPALLALVLFLWTPSHFWALAILLKEDYARAKLPMLPVLAGNKITARVIFVNSLLMVTVAALPWLFGEMSAVYGVLSMMLGALLLWCNWRLVQLPDREWARRNFFASMQYLAALFVVVLLDANWW
ncbi:Protoheme IX farnesyltransferase 1 [Azospirillaceae bacterium]